MKVGILGTGMVGQAIGTKLVQLDHEVVMGSRTRDNAGAVSWAEANDAAHGTFADAASTSEIVINATAGAASLEALQLAGEEALSDKILVDVANPIAPDSGMPPSLSVCNTDSLGEQIQRRFPRTRVVKTLNTMNCEVMVDPSQVPGSHVVFVCGEEPTGKAVVSDLLASFGWPREDILDLGGIEAARGTEMYLALWLRLWGVVGTGQFNINIAR